MSEPYKLPVRVKKEHVVPIGSSRPEYDRWLLFEHENMEPVLGFRDEAKANQLVNALNNHGEAAKARQADTGKLWMDIAAEREEEIETLKARDCGTDDGACLSTGDIMCHACSYASRVTEELAEKDEEIETLKEGRDKLRGSLPVYIHDGVEFFYSIDVDKCLGEKAEEIEVLEASAVSVVASGDVFRETVEAERKLLSEAAGFVGELLDAFDPNGDSTLGAQAWAWMLRPDVERIPR